MTQTYGPYAAAWIVASQCQKQGPGPRALAAELDAAKRHGGELSMENELLRERVNGHSEFPHLRSLKISPPLVDHNDETSTGGRCGQAVCGRVFRNLAGLRAAVAEFVERYHQCWRLEKLAYRTPSEACQEYVLRQAA